MALLGMATVVVHMGVGIVVVACTPEHAAGAAGAAGPGVGVAVGGLGGLGEKCALSPLPRRDICRSSYPPGSNCVCECHLHVHQAFVYNCPLLVVLVAIVPHVTEYPRAGDIAFLDVGRRGCRPCR